METPPPIPDPQPPLGRGFYIWLLAPVASMAVAAAAPVIGGRNSGLEGFGVVLSLISMVGMIACSVVCAVMVGKRKGGGLGVLTFLGIQVVYVSVAFAGCVAMIGKMDFR
jgi:hypothetical protein